jgi:uncharacterized delta-60 repeat protein
MLSTRFARIGLAAAAALLAHTSIASVASAQYGFNDPTFNPADNGLYGDGADGDVYSTEVQPDGKFLIVGSFGYYNTAKRRNIARINVDGSVDTSFQTNPGPDWPVHSLALQPDGKVLIGGDFATYDGVPRASIARLDSDGGLDTTFDPGSGLNNRAAALALQPDGKIVIVGGFTTFNGVPTPRIARLHPDGSLDTSFAAGVGADNLVSDVVRLSDGRFLIGGDFASYGGVARSRIARLHADGQLDLSFDPGAGFDEWVRAIVAQSDGRVLVGGFFTMYDGVVRKGVARLQANGALDASFDAGAGFNGGIYGLSVQPNGHVLVGGTFPNYEVLRRLRPDGSPDGTLAFSTSSGNGLFDVRVLPDGKLLVAGDLFGFGMFGPSGFARLESDGAADRSFNAIAGPNHAVRRIVHQPDGRILVAGAFKIYAGEKRRGLARIHPDGSLDSSFDVGDGPNSYHLWDTALQPDGKVLVAGSFTEFDGVPRPYIARVHGDGSLDASFDPGVGPDNPIYGLALQPDGRIVIAGAFVNVSGISRNRVARLNADGSLDASFDPGVGVGYSHVNAVLLQADGRVLIGGEFTTVGGAARHRLARLNSNGTLDTSFAPAPGTDWLVRSLALQPDGKVLIGGPFSTYNGVPRSGIARINSDGSLDTSFDPGPGMLHEWASVPSVYALVVQSDGRILVGGSFTSAAGRPRRSIARFFADGSLDPSLPGLPGTYSTVNSIALEPSGRALLGGNFTSYDGAVRHRIARMIAYSPTPLSYCTAGTSTNGCAPTIGSSGTPSLANTSGFTLDVTGVEGQRQGLLFYGIGGRKADAWSPGSTSVLCVKAPMQRMSVASTGGAAGQCNGALSTDWLAYVSANPTAVGAPFAAGVTVSAQGWFRDPPAPKSTNLSNALEFVTAP